MADADGTVICALGRLPIGRDAPMRGAGVTGPVVVAVRAESVRIGPPTPGALRGCVVATRPRARGATVVVRLENAPLDVEAAVRGGDPDWRIGDAVSVSVDPVGVLAYPA